jgi:SulP family sulfate permease
VNIKNNILSGITSAVVALPLALAFGIASGLGAVAGIYGAILLGFFAAAFGGTKVQISGPTGPMTVVMAGIVTLFANDIYMIAFVVLLAGSIQVVFGVIKVGRFVNYIPYPVISGFMSGIGVIIIILQLHLVVGTSFSGSIMDTLLHFPSTLASVNFDALLLSLLTFLVLFFTPKKITQITPPALIALIGITSISVGFGFEVPTIGPLPHSMPTFALPEFNFEHLKVIIPYAFTLAILGSIDSLLTSVVADSLTKTKHNSNQELIGQGIGNTVCGLFGALPGAGATMRTVINIKSGGTDRLSGIVHSLALAIFILGGSFLVENIPLAILAAILIKVGIDILDYRFLKNITKAPLHDISVMITVLFLTIFVDLIVAVGVGIVLASLLLVKRMSDKITISSEVIHKTKLEQNLSSQILVMHIDGAFFFGTTNQIVSRTSGKMDIKVLVFDCTRVPFMDLSALFALEESIGELLSNDIKVVIALKDDITKKRFDKLGLTKLITEENIFNNLQNALLRAEDIA